LENRVWTSVLSGIFNVLGLKPPLAGQRKRIGRVHE
jgi:hypothetical protein